MSHASELTQREQQILGILMVKKQATAREILAELPAPPTNATVRKLLSIMKEKGLIGHRKQSREFVYYPSSKIDSMKTGAIEKTVNTYFEGSLPMAFSALLDVARGSISDGDLDELQRIIDVHRNRESDNE